MRRAGDNRPSVVFISSKKTVVCFLMILTATTHTIMLIRTVIYSLGGLITIMKPTMISPPWGAENRTYLKTINEKTYLFGPKGLLLRNTATDISTTWNGFCVSNENGVVKTGVIRLEENRIYYFNPEIYLTTPLSGEWAEYDVRLYHFENPISVSPDSKGSPITTTII